MRVVYILFFMMVFNGLYSQCADIYFLRGKLLQEETNVKIFCNDEKLLTSKLGSRFKVQFCAQGEYTFKVSTKSSQLGYFANKTLQIEKGKTYYLNITVPIGFDEPILKVMNQGKGEKFLKNNRKFNHDLEEIQFGNPESAVVEKNRESSDSPVETNNRVEPPQLTSSHSQEEPSKSNTKQKEVILEVDFWQQISPIMNWDVKHSSIYRREHLEREFGREAKVIYSFHVLSNGSMTFSSHKTDHFVSNDFGKTWQPFQLLSPSGQSLVGDLSISRVYYTKDYYVIKTYEGKIYLSDDGKIWKKAGSSFDFKKHLIFGDQLYKIRNYDSVSHLNSYKNAMLIFDSDNNTVTVDPEKPIYELEVATGIYTKTDRSPFNFGKFERVFESCEGVYHHYRNPNYPPLKSTDLITFIPDEQLYNNELEKAMFMPCPNYLGQYIEDNFLLKKIGEDEWINTGVKMQELTYNPKDKSFYGIRLDSEISSSSFGEAILWKSKIPIDCMCDDEK